MKGCIRRQSSDGVSDLSKIVEINASVFDVSILFRVLDFLPLGVNPVLGIKLKVLRFLVRGFKISHSLIIDFFESCFRDTLADELLAVNVSDRVHVFDNSIHERLSVRRLIEFIVTHFTVPDQINDDIFAKFLTVLGSDAERVGYIVH